MKYRLRGVGTEVSPYIGVATTHVLTVMYDVVKAARQHKLDLVYIWWGGKVIPVEFGRDAGKEISYVMCDNKELELRLIDAIMLQRHLPWWARATLEFIYLFV